MTRPRRKCGSGSQAIDLITLGAFGYRQDDFSAGNLDLASLRSLGLLRFPECAEAAPETWLLAVNAEGADARARSVVLDVQAHFATLHF